MKLIVSTEVPPITSYPAIANILSLLWTRKENVIPWFSDHFIQLMIRPYNEYSKADFYDHADVDNYYSTLFGCPGLDWMRNNVVTAGFDRFSKYVEYQIKQGFCLEPCLDRYYFEFSKSYQKEHFIHSTFVYGFDDIKQQIYIADFFEGGKYEKRIISYSEIDESIRGNNGIINLYRCADDEYTFNYNMMKLYLNDYINSRDSLHKFEFSSSKRNQNALFGIAYYDYIVDNECSAIDFIDVRPFHILTDHKKMMKIRLDYLSKINILNEEAAHELSLENDKLLNETNILKNLVIKYNITKKNKILENIKNKCLDLKEADYIFVNDLLKYI